MKKRLLLIALAIVVALPIGWYFLAYEKAELSVDAVTGATPELKQPVETLIPTVNVAKGIGWPEGAKPTPATGLAVAEFAGKLDHPRWMTLLPNGDVLVAETNSPPRQPPPDPSIKDRIQGWVMGILFSRVGAGVPSANRITLLRDTDGDGVAESRSVLVSGLNSPFGMAIAGGYLYVANTDALVRFPFTPGQTKIDAEPEKIVDLPGGYNHWARNVIANADGSRLYVTVGSASNIAEHGIALEEGRAAVWEVDPATKKHRIYAGGLRNPNGLAWEPTTNALWTVVNERDMLGSDLVPDYLTSVEFGGFYGWPYSYWGVTDERVKPERDDLLEYTRKPDYALGPHTASLGLTFANGQTVAPQFAEGAFIGQHGSWNRRPRSGYKVIFVPFKGGKPAGKPVDVLTGFLDGSEEAQGRPVGVVLDRTGALLVADDVGNKIWRVTGTK